MSFSTMYVGATGVKAHGMNMQVVGNNLANVSTVGYKKADGQFTNLMSQQMVNGGAQYDSGAYSYSQIGKGVALGEVRNIFKEGGLENTNNITDLAITGNGFFGVRKVTGSAAGGSGATHFTRAGAFRFNNDAYLVDPHDYRLQGYAIDRDTGAVSTTLSDVQLPFQDVVDENGEVNRLVRSAPKLTTRVEMVTTLDALSADRFQGGPSPMFSLLSAYNGTLSNSATPFGAQAPEYSSSIAVFDENGNERDMTVYFDPITPSQLSNASPGYTYWEYVVAMPASADGSAAAGTSGAGLAGMGVLVFNGQGEMVNHAAFELQLTSGASGKSLNSWVPSTFSEDGVPNLSFTFGNNGSAVGGVQAIGYDFGLSSTAGAWSGGASNAGAVGANVRNLGEMAGPARDVRVTTSFDSGSATIYQIQNGYASGFLQHTSVTREGVLSGYFSNGQTEEFYKIGVYRFNSEWGLRRDGNNNFVATQASGNPTVGVANDQGRGTVQQNTLEMSNVDMAEEFAKMILTQRGYQANTKVITTADSLVNTAISIKR